MTLRSLKLANKFYESLSEETQNYMLEVYSESGFDNWEGFLKECVVGFMNAEYRKKQAENLK